MKTIKPYNLEWQAISPSFFRWKGVEIFYVGREFGWRVADNGVHCPDHFYSRDDAMLHAEHAFSLQPIAIL